MKTDLIRKHLILHAYKELVLSEVEYKGEIVLSYIRYTVANGYINKVFEFNTYKEALNVFAISCWMYKNKKNDL